MRHLPLSSTEVKNSQIVHTFVYSLLVITTTSILLSFLDRVEDKTVASVQDVSLVSMVISISFYRCPQLLLICFVHIYPTNNQINTKPHSQAGPNKLELVNAYKYASPRIETHTVCYTDTTGHNNSIKQVAVLVLRNHALTWGSLLLCCCET